MARDPVALLALVCASALLEPARLAAEPAPVQTAVVEAVRTADPLVFDGRVQALRHADVSNRIDGVVSAIHFTAGQSVRTGDLLFELAPES